MSDNVLAGWSVLTEWPRLRPGHSAITDRQLVHYPILKAGKVWGRWFTNHDSEWVSLRGCKPSTWTGRHPWRNRALTDQGGKTFQKAVILKKKTARHVLRNWPGEENWAVKFPTQLRRERSSKSRRVPSPRRSVLFDAASWSIIMLP